MVLGPDFDAADEASYNQMVELDSKSVAAFWRRLEANAQASKKPAGVAAEAAGAAGNLLKP